MSGAGCRGFREPTLTNDLAKIGPGKAQYTLVQTNPAG